MKPPGVASVERAKTDPLLGMQLLAESGIALHTVRIGSGLDPKTKKGELQWIGKHPSIPHFEGLSLRGATLQKNTAAALGSLTSAKRLDLSDTRAELSGLYSLETR